MSAAQRVYTPTPSQTASMKMHLSRRDQWVYARVNGKAIIVMPSSDGRRVYYTGRSGECCTCPGSRHYPMCSHMWAAREAANQDNLSAYLADAADELLAEYEAEQAYKGYQAVLTLARMGGFCVERGCQEDAVRGEDFCRAHMLVDVA